MHASNEWNGHDIMDLAIETLPRPDVQRRRVVDDITRRHVTQSKSGSNNRFCAVMPNSKTIKLFVLFVA